MEPIFHIADQTAWDEATASGIYAQSTRDQSLADVGFIHCSYRHQVRGVADAYYADVTTPLVLLTIDVKLLEAPLQIEDGFPHIYGALNTGAVIEVGPVHA